MIKTPNELPPLHPDYDIEQLIEANTALLRISLAILNDLPADGASKQELDDWANKWANTLAKGENIPEHFVGDWSSFIWSYVDPLLNPIRDSINTALTDSEAFATNSVKALRVDLTKITDNVTKDLDSLKSDIASLFYKAVKAEVELAEKLLTDISEPIVGPLKTKLDEAKEIFEIAYKLNDAKILDTEQRIIWVGDALAFVLKNDEIKKITDDLGSILKADNDSARLAALEDLIRTIVVSSSPMLIAISWVVESVKAEHVVVPNFGMGFTPGRLYEFLNGPDEMHPVVGDEREFRIELVSTLDRYFHGQYEMPSAPNAVPRQTNSVDSKLAIQTLTDVFRIVLQTSFGFVFRAPHLPSLMAPKMSLLQPSVQLHHQAHLVAAKHASATMSRALSAPVKALSGLLLRGAWEVNAHNDALIELVATSISQIIGSLTETLTHSLFSLLEVREVYDIPDDEKRCLLSWSTQAEWAKGKKTFQAVIVVGGIVGDEKLEKDFLNAITGLLDAAKKDGRVSMLQNLLKDYGAYLELTRDCHEPIAADDSIKIELKAISKSSTSVTATYIDPDKDLPVVLRVYADGQHAIMDRNHTAQLTNIPDGAAVHVLAGNRAHGSKIYKKSDISAN